jgi:hypothetical protein
MPRRLILEHFAFLRGNAVAAMPDVVGAFVRHEEAEGGGHEVADVLERARTRGAQERFQFGEGELDGVEVWTVGWEKPHGCASLLDGHSDLRLLVGGEVVENDDVASPQGGDQHLLDIGAERVVIDRAIEHGRGTQLGRAEGGDDRVGLPVAAGRVIGDARALEAAGVAAQKIRGDAGLVHEDILRRIMERQCVGPAAPGRRDIRSPLFVRVDAFF